MNKNIQDNFLNSLQQKTAVIVIVNGFQLKGRIISHDQFTLLVEIDGKQQLIYKHAVSTIKGG